MSAPQECSMEGPSSALLSALEEISLHVQWADDAATLYKSIQEVYQQHSDETTEDLFSKVKEMEKYVTLDLERHIALGLCRPPYYLQCLQSHLDRALAMLGETEAGERKTLDHLVAELQASFVEHGFCSSLEAIFDTEEADLRLQQLSNRLKKIASPDHDPSLALVELHSVVAVVSGMQQAMTPANITKMQAKFNSVQQRITVLENNISSCNMKVDSQLFAQFLASQHLLRRSFVKALEKEEPTEVINSHVIHPGTRGWILERVSRWLLKSRKKVFFLCGKQGSGKTALASAICKLHNHDVAACHFFSVSRGDSMNNQTVGLVISIARDLCRVLPEYLNYLDDNVSEDEIETTAKQSWTDAYDILLKRPLRALYGSDPPASPVKRKLIVIDSLDEATFTEWTSLKQFFERFLADFSAFICILATVRTKHSGAFNIENDEKIEILQFENRAWQSWHIKDVEVYISSSVGAILSGEDERGTPQHAKVDQRTLQNTMDELLKCSAGRFDYAIALMESFAAEMAAGGQFLGSVKKAMMPMKQSHRQEVEAKISSFASPYRAYRDKEGRAVDVRVMRQSHYLMDKSRVALIRGRHQINALNGK